MRTTANQYCRTHVISEVGSARKENQEVEALNWFDQQQDIGTDHNLVVEVYKIIFFSLNPMLSLRVIYVSVVCS